MRLFQDLIVYRQLAEQVARPNQLGSFLQLVRRARITDDSARRALERLKCEFNDPLLLIQDRHAVLTDAGRELLALAVRMSSLANGVERPPEVLTVESDSFLAANLLPQAFLAFLDFWGSTVQPRICPPHEELPRNIQNGTTAFGVVFAGSGEAVSRAETLGPKVGWALVMALTHRLAGDAGPLVAGDLSVNDRVFIPTLGVEWPGMDAFLEAVPKSNQIECDGSLAVRLASGVGAAAVVPDLFADQDSVCKRAIQGVEPLQPRFILPRNGMDGLTEPEQSLVEEIRKSAEARGMQATPEATEAAEEVVEALVEEPGLQLEGAL